MRGRKPNPDTPFRIRLHIANGYRYASTSQTETKEGKRYRKYTHWGQLTLENKFIPNLKYILTSVEEREKLIFPEDWDISEALELNKARPDRDKIETVTEEEAKPQETSGISDGLVLPLPPAEGYYNRLYGSVWLLLRIAEQKNIVKDLRVVFEYNEETVNNILTLAIFPYLTRRKLDRLESAQDVYRFPAETVLTPGVINRFTQAITDTHRMEFCKLRIDRQPKDAYVVCDLTTRTACGDGLADTHYSRNFSRNKDNKELNCTREVVVYSMTAHEPVYYRTFPGNISDARAAEIISNDMKQLGTERLITIFDREYESDGNFDEFFEKVLPFITWAEVAQEPVIDCLQLIKYDSYGIPENMSNDKETGLFYAQFSLEGRRYIDENGQEREVSANDYRCNVYLDPAKRLVELFNVNTAIQDEYNSLKEKEARGLLINERISINSRLNYHLVTFTCSTDGNGTESWKAEIQEDERKIKKSKACCGFFSSVTYKAEGNALEMLRILRTRDERDEYFEQMKDQMDFNSQDVSSEKSKNGLEFILLIGLILSSTVRNVWKQDTELKKRFTTSLAVLDEMEKIRLYEYPDGTSKMTAFVGPQVQICEAFGLKPPENCMPAVMKHAEARKK